MDRDSIVLCGGYSTRFGDEDKALASAGGQPMLVRVVDRLGAATDSVVVNCRDEQRAGFERALSDTEVRIRFAVDPVSDLGPLAGLATALKAVDTEYVAVVACDMPGVDPDFVAYLFERARGHDAAIPETKSGHLQPVQAVYRRDAISAAAERELDDGNRSLHGAIDRLDAVVVTGDEVSSRTFWQSLRDVNTRKGLDEFSQEVYRESR